MRKLIIVFAILFGSITVRAQETELFRSDIEHYRTGIDLYEKEKYSAAIFEFEQAQKQIRDETSEIYANSSYFKAVCALRLFNRNAAYLLREFIKNYPESPRVKDAYFQLGKYYYRKRDWEKVVSGYDKIDAFDLTPKQSHEYYFRKGYALYQLDSLTESKRNFSEIKDLPGLYYDPANYYYGQIAYDIGNYQTALKAFKKIEHTDNFEHIVPYYITQIYYHEKQYDSLISYAIPFSENPRTKRKAEINRLIGEAYFARGEYNKAVDYLAEYLSEPGAGTRQDYFQLGYAHKMSGNCGEAVKNFQKATYEKDSLAQAANYLQAECQLKLGEKKAARSSFRNASKLSFNEKIQEDALFSFARLSYETDFDPYNNAIDAFIEYLEKYENGYRKDEVYEYLVDIYLNTKNYESAIASLETTMGLDDRLKNIYQQLLYNQATEYFLNTDYKSAAETFEKSSNTPQDRESATRALYWKAESHYRSGHYKTAIRDFKKFLYEPRAILLDEFPEAHYSIGYAYFQTREYAEAASWFRKFVNYENTDSTKANDAYIRIGDAYFVTKNYLLSLEFYEKALDYGKLDIDYTLYQLAIANGILKKGEEKIELLEKLLSDHPDSDFFAAASFELGRSYLQSNRPDKALTVFDDIITRHEHSSYKKRAQVSKGLIYYNRNEINKALDIFKTVVRENPSYSESKEALRAIQNIYLERGDIASYEDYIKSLGFLNVSDAALDSLNYESAELQYLSGNCAKATESLKEYLEKFENPLFYLHAHFYIAECLIKADKKDEALAHYEAVADRPLNKFSEEAQRRAADMNYGKENHLKAYRYYEKLTNTAQKQDNKQQALIGLMRTSHKLGKYQKAAETASQVLELNKIPKSVIVEAHFITAESYALRGDTASALTAYKIVTDSTRNERAAESKYRIAEIFFKQGQIDTAQKAVFSLINHNPAYDYWLAKGLVLLADIYIAKDDAFQAEATLRNILDNYDGDEQILEESRRKLDALIERENPVKKEREETEIDLSTDSIDYDNLLPDEKIDEKEDEEIELYNDDK